MAVVTIDNQYKTHLAETFVNSYDPFRRKQIFAGFGNVVADAQTTRTEENDEATRRNILFMKSITPNDVSLMINRNDWVSGTVYDQYDPTADMTTKNWYVFSPTNNSVYACVKNGDGSQSTIIPNTTAPEVEIFSDGYEWRYLYTVSSDKQKFVDSSYIPIQTLPYYSDLITGAYSDTAKQNQYYSQYNAINDSENGKISRIDITTVGTAVYGRVIKSTPDRTLLAAGLTGSVLGGGIASSTDDYYNGYAIRFIDGNAIGRVEKITDYIGVNNEVVYGAMTGSIPSIGDKYEIVPLVEITGDGTGCTAFAEVSNTFIPTGVALASNGSNYTTATASITTTKDSGTNLTLTPRIFDSLGQDPVKELLPTQVKLRVLVEGGESNLAMTGNDFNEVIFWEDPTVGLSYDDSGLVAGHNNYPSTVIDVEPTTGSLSSSFVTDYTDAFVYGRTSKYFGEVSIAARDSDSSGSITVKNLYRNFTNAEVLERLATVGSSLASQSSNIKPVRTRELDSVYTISKTSWRCTHEIGIDYDSGNGLPSIDTSITGASGSIGIISQVIQHPSAPTGATIFVTNVIKSSGSGTLDFTPSEIITTDVGGVTVSQLTGPELDLQSGNLLYINGITAVNRRDSSDDAIELVIDF